MLRRISWISDEEGRGIGAHAGDADLAFCKAALRAGPGHGGFAEHHTRAAKRLSQDLIVARQGANAFAALLVEIVHEIDEGAGGIAIGLGEDDVEADGGGAEARKPVHQIGDHRARPRPLPQGFQAFFVDVDDDRGVRRGFAWRGKLEEVEGSQPQLLERRRIDHPQRCKRDHQGKGEGPPEAEPRGRSRERAQAPGPFRRGVATWQEIGNRKPRIRREDRNPRPC